MPEETSPVLESITFDQAEQMIELLLGLQQIGFWMFGAIFILIGLITMQLFFVGKGGD